MSVEAVAEPNSSKDVEARESNEADDEIGGAVSEDSVVLDQIILAPEIMNLILKLMDFRSLKKSRLICKSWLLAAQFQMERRGIVQLPLHLTPVHKFLDTVNSQLPDLPPPFRSMDMSLQEGFLEIEALDQLSEFRSPLAITRFSPKDIALNLILPVIFRCSPTLEILELCSYNWELPVPPMDPKHIFPKLRHLKVDDWTRHSEHGSEREADFSSIVAWIMGASPALETFKSCSRNQWTHEGYLRLQLESELLLKVNIKQLKSFGSFHTDVNRAVCKHFLPLPTNGPENLRMRLDHGVLHVGDALLATVAKCTATLWTTGSLLASIPAFPACPNILELTLGSFREWNFLRGYFPSLQALTIQEFHVDVHKDDWRNLSPCLGLKTLRFKDLYYWRGFENRDKMLPVKVFEKFPGLERVRLNSSFALRCCRMKAAGDSRYSNLLEGIKHLELWGSHLFSNLDPDLGILGPGFLS